MLSGTGYPDGSHIKGNYNTFGNDGHLIIFTAYSKGRNGIIQHPTSNQEM
jgi:hypothetical protein